MSAPATKAGIRKVNETLILETAERAFATSGYEGTSIAQIARAAGLPKANVHYYFKTKSDLYRQVLKHILEDWMSATAAFENHAEPEQALRTYVKAKMEFSRARPFGSRVWANEIMSGAPVMEEFLGTILKKWVDRQARIMRGWVRDGKIQHVQPSALLYMIWATTQHYADFERQIVILNGGKEISDRQYHQRTDQVVEMILRSVGL